MKEEYTTSAGSHIANVFNEEFETLMLKESLPMSNSVSLQFLKVLAKAHDWDFLCFQENIGMASFTKEDMRINVYTTKRTVGTCLNHPKQGKTQLFRKNVGNKELGRIFENPRVHTNKGYKKK